MKPDPWTGLKTAYANPFCSATSILSIGSEFLPAIADERICERKKPRVGLGAVNSVAAKMLLSADDPCPLEVSIAPVTLYVNPPRKRAFDSEAAL